LRGMVKDSPRILPASAWPKHYVVSVVDRSVEGVATFELKPRDETDPLETAVVTVDHKTGLVSRYEFFNKNGSTIVTDQTYQQIGKHQFVVATTGNVRGSGYRAEVATTFSNYHINVPVPDEVFEKN